MNGIRRLSAATATMALVALLAACGRNGSDTAEPVTSTTTPPVTAATSIATTAPPTTADTTTPPPPLTPEEKIDALAEQHGWTLDVSSDDDSYDSFDDDTGEDTVDDSPSAFVQDMCDSLPDQTDNGPAQWLAETQATEPDQMSILKAGIPLLCPEWTKTVKQAASGHYPVYVSDGTYKVTSKRAEDTIPPGAYRTTGDLQGCYWERTRANGEIIDNNFATAATKITVTILSSDDLFTSQDCGTWKPID